MRIVGISRSFAKKAESDLELFSKLVDFQGPEHSPTFLTDQLYFEKNGDKSLIMTKQNGGLVAVGLVESTDFWTVRKEVLKNGAIRGLVEARRGKVVPAEKSLLGALRVF
ncbi:MAG: hypothetical protein GOV00_04325 [Candidatus Altiarchaeota archaeon]|nr:hypothetical protein [Candidatus Altiarchaeota archaeon]